MPGANVQWQPPLTRLNPWYPGQMGVPGTDNITGLREHCTGKVLYVDPNYPGTSDQRDGTDPTCPLTTIQAAVNLCTSYAGDVILVMHNADWQYAGGTVYTTGIVESVTLNKAGVRIVGLSASAMGVPWCPAASLGTCLTITAMDCTVEGFLFHAGAFAGADGIRAVWDGLTQFADAVTIRHCLFDDQIDTAIQLEYCWYCDIHGNYFQECDEYGIYVDPAGSGIAYCLIHDNVFHDCGTAAMSLNGCDKAQIYRNSIFNAHAQAAAAATNEGIDTTAGGENMVFDNWFSCLLPVPANGDYDDLNSAAASDAWIGNHVMNGLAVTNPT